MSQNPSAAEASTGPNTRAAARAKANTPDNAAHGSRPRAVWHPVEVQPEARLDVEGVAWLGKRLREEMNHGLAIVMASHEPALVETLGARTVELGGPRG